jgi:hypothetical protein
LLRKVSQLAATFVLDPLVDFFVNQRTTLDLGQHISVKRGALFVFAICLLGIINHLDFVFIFLEIELKQSHIVFKLLNANLAQCELSGLLLDLFMHLDHLLSLVIVASQNVSDLNGCSLLAPLKLVRYKVPSFFF